MRLWHKDLIPYLPRLQLISQWKECCCIAKNLADMETPNHLLVNKVMNYPMQHFAIYTYQVLQEMRNRKYNISATSLQNFISNTFKACECFNNDTNLIQSDIFSNWHTERYLKQCFYNLQEKYDCGGITTEEWERLETGFLQVEQKYQKTQEITK